MMRIDLHRIERTARMIGKRVYFLSRRPKEDLLSDQREMRRVVDFGGLIPAVLERWYKNYKSGIGRRSAHDPRFNYIYRATKPFKLLDLSDERDLEHYFETVLTGEFREYWAKYNQVQEKSEEEQLQKLKEIKRRRVVKEEEWAIDPVFSPEGLRNKFWERMQEVFDGTINPESFGHCKIFVDRLKNDMKLVDGNVVRFGKPERAEEGSYPGWVIDSLVAFTKDAGKRLPRGVVQWLQENTPREDHYRLYRGTGLFFNTTFGWWGGDNEDKPSEEEFDKVLKRRFGLTLDQVNKGSQVKVKRSKPSSWSLTPQVAREFTAGMANRDLNFLIVAEVPGDKVVVDLTKVPEDVQKQLLYPNQNEVILATGTIQGTINDVWTSEKFDHWFAELPGRRGAVAVELDLHRIANLARIASTGMYFGQDHSDIDDGPSFALRTRSHVHGGKVILMEMTEREWENEIRGKHQPVIAEDGQKWPSAQEWQQEMERDGWELIWMTPARQRQEARRWRDWAESKEEMGWPKELTEKGRERSDLSRERADDLKQDEW